MLALRSGWLGWAGLAILYFALAALTITTTRVGNGVSIIWIANALAIAQLLGTPRRAWRPALVACALGSCAATSLFGFGPVAAAPFAVANLLEAVAAAWVFRRLAGRTSPLDSLRGFSIFALGAGIVGPAVGALCGGMLAAMLGQPFFLSVINWFTGHSLGALTFTPLILLFVRGDLRDWARDSGWAKALEGAALLAAVVAASVLVFFQARYPALFLPLLPIMVATFRAGQLGAAASVIILSLVAGYATLNNVGPLSWLAVAPETKLQFLQLYLAFTVMTVLPASAELTWRRQLFSRLQESETRYRLLAENSTDIILNIGRDGRISFASPSVATISGYQPRDVIGRQALDFVDPEDVPIVQAAHARAIAAPGHTETVEYRAITANGERAWAESQTQGYFDESGQVIGVVSAIRNIDQRKAREKRLAVEADTDGLTGVLNRRAFMRALGAAARSQRQSEHGCLAIFDIDHFKQINDRFGHAEGDRVLIEFVRIARQTVREHDVIGRIGGEEFAVLLTGADTAQTEAVCERLRAYFAMSVKAGGKLTVTVSAGASELTPPVDTAEVLRLADEALYRAKRGGRNRLELAA